VNLYGRVLGVWFTEAFSGVIGREGEDEISDIKDQCIRSKQMIINYYSSDITFVTIFHSAICDYSSILSVIQDLKKLVSYLSIRICSSVTMSIFAFDVVFL